MSTELVAAVRVCRRWNASVVIGLALAAGCLAEQAHRQRCDELDPGTPCGIYYSSVEWSFCKDGNTEVSCWRTCGDLSPDDGPNVRVDACGPGEACEGADGVGRCQGIPSRTLGESCNEHEATRCVGDLVCALGQCRQACGAQDTCDPGMVCREGGCLEVCDPFRGGEDCPPLNGRLRAGCLLTESGSGLCVGATSEDSVDGDCFRSSCGRGLFCSDGSRCRGLCDATHPCDQGRRCLPREGWATGVCEGDLGNTCTEHATCRVGLVCSGGVCRQHCASDAACVEGHVCVEAACIPACLPGGAADAGSCAATPVRTTCKPTQSGFACVASGSGTTCASVHGCTGGLACASGSCVPWCSPEDPSCPTGYRCTATDRIVAPICMSDP